MLFSQVRSPSSASQHRQSVSAWVATDDSLDRLDSLDSGSMLLRQDLSTVRRYSCCYKIAMTCCQLESHSSMLIDFCWVSMSATVFVCSAATSAGRAGPGYRPDRAHQGRPPEVSNQGTAGDHSSCYSSTFQLAGLAQEVHLTLTPHCSEKAAYHELSTAATPLILTNFSNCFA